MTRAMENESVLILTVPDCIIDLDSQYFLCSSSGDFDQERLRFFERTLFPIWYENRYTLHQLANALVRFDISLWTAPDVETNQAYDFAFWMRFNSQYQGDILVQCQLIQQGRIH